MKVNELLTEAPLPGIKKPGLLSKFFGKGEKLDPEIQKSIKTGVDSWLAHVKKLQSVGTLNKDSGPEEYVAQFIPWASTATKIPKNSPTLTKLTDQFKSELVTNPDKALENVIKGLVSLSLKGGTDTYTPDQKAQAVSKFIDQKYGKYIKDIKTKVTLEKFIKDQITKNPDIEPQALQDDAINYLTQLLKPRKRVKAISVPTTPTTPTGGTTT